jgi:type IV pilus modification protein pilV
MFSNRSPLPPRRVMRGSTLLEVMVSVFIMAFGIMALMLAQIKSVSNVREAEMQTRVAQVVQNLMSGMLNTPVPFNTVAAASAAAVSSPSLSYANYKTSGWQNVAPLSDVSTPNNIADCGDNQVKTDAAIKACYTQNFALELANALPNAKQIQYQITSNANTTTVSVQWTESDSGDAADDYTFNYSAVVGD